MLFKIGGQFKVNDYFAKNDTITLLTNVKPDFNVLRQSKTLEVTPMVRTAKKVIIAPKAEDFLYIRNRAVSAGNVIEEDAHHVEVIPMDEYLKNFDRYAYTTRGANDNGDFFSDEELERSYKTFIGKPTFVNHQNENVEDARGIILDAVYNEDGKYVELLKAIDRKAYPELARAIEMGYATCTSMGCRCGSSVCSICGNEAHSEDEFCEHIINFKGSTFQNLPVWEINQNVTFFEDSMVSIGADPQAKILEKVANRSGCIGLQTHSKYNSQIEYNIKNEKNQRSAEGQLTTFSKGLSDLPWS
jgi:hypothetical protein